MSLARARAVLTCFHVLGLLVVVELLIRWVPLPRLGELLRVRLDFRPVMDVDVVADGARVPLPPRARRRLRCTWRMAGIWPFSAGPCLRRSLVAARLLRHDGAAVRIGFPVRPGDRIAHAWVELDGRPIEDVSSYRAFEARPAGAA